MEATKQHQGKIRLILKESRAGQPQGVLRKYHVAALQTPWTDTDLCWLPELTYLGPNGPQHDLKSESLPGESKDQNSEAIIQTGFYQRKHGISNKIKWNKNLGEHSNLRLDPATEKVRNLLTQISKRFGDAMNVRTKYSNLSVSPGIQDMLFGSPRGELGDAYSYLEFLQAKSVQVSNSLSSSAEVTATSNNSFHL